MIGWIWQRISGILLFILLFIHLIKASFVPLDYKYIKIQLITPKWLLFSIFLLFLAVSHAMNGLWQIGQDYLKDKSKKPFFYFLWIMGIIFILLGVSIFVRICMQASA